jgi:hypothetical protein
MTSPSEAPRWGATPIPERVAQRALTRFVVAEDGCHISTYSTASHGYAQIGWTPTGEGNKGTLAHRAAWAAVNGQIPEGMTVDHLCKNRRCVNPDHLRLLPNYENARRINGWDWPLGECRHGHPNSMLRRQSDGRIKCHACRMEWQRRHRAKKRARLAQQRGVRGDAA